MQTRARLIDAATRAFTRRGFRAASVEEIAEEAGYSYGAVYSNFDSKADLFLAVFEKYMAEQVLAIAEIQDALPEDAPLQIRAHALADQWMDRLARDRESVVLHMQFISHADRDPELARRLSALSSAMRRTVARYISHSQQEAGSELPMPVDDLALVLSALAIGLAVESLVNPDAVRHSLYGDFIELLTRIASAT